MKYKIFSLFGLSMLALFSLSFFLPMSFVRAAPRTSMAKDAAANPSWPASYFAPYAYVMPGPSDDSKPSLITDAAKQVGVKYFTLAFVISNGCKAIWGDMSGMSSSDPIMAAINQVRQGGGDVSISFGGADGTELGQACKDVASLQKQYQSVIDTYQVTHLDFDIEGAAVADTASVDRRNQAIAALQKANPGLSITYTLPVMPDGLDDDGVKLLKSASKNNVQVSMVNVMTMDYGSDTPPDKMGQNAISAAQATEKQVTSVGMAAKIGITSMIGVNDTAPETTQLADARQIAAFAKQNPYVGELSMWSISRDKACSGGGGGGASSTCSGVDQKPYDFSKIFMGIDSATAPVKPAAPKPSAKPAPAPSTQSPQPQTQPAAPAQPSTQPSTKPSRTPKSPTSGAISALQANLLFPCSDIPGGPNGTLQPNESVIAQDWLSGDQGRLSSTAAADTYQFPQVMTLFGYMDGAAFLIITPAIILIGYQMMFGALSPSRYASALEGLKRIILSGAAVAVCFGLIQMIITLENSIASAIIILHTEQPFPKPMINGSPVLYTLPNESATSYRGLVVPMSRWGCMIRAFTGVFSTTLVRNIGVNVPLIRSFVPFAAQVTSMPDLIQRLGQMGVTLLSILLWVQEFTRVLLLNYYILAAPLAFGSWGLPGGVGQNVVRLWFKGFLSVLFVQVVQLFVLTTLPLILPVPQPPTDGTGILQSILIEFLPILALSIVVMAPTFVGSSMTKAFATAGSIAKEVIIAVGESSASIGRKQDGDTKSS